MCERKAEQHIVRVRTGACGVEEPDVQLSRRIFQDGQSVVPPFAVVAGVPARILRYRTDAEDRGGE